MNSYAASVHQRNGKQFRRLQATTAALAAGAISYGMATAITAAVDVLKNDDAARVAEETLLNLARDEFSTVEKVARAGKYLRQVLDPDGHQRDEEKAHRNRYLTAHLEDDGSITGSYRLPPEAAARLQALLDKYARKSGSDDTRTQSQRNADVLIQLLVQAVTAELLIIVNAETLTDDPADVSVEDDAEDGPADDGDAAVDDGDAADEPGRQGDVDDSDSVDDRHVDDDAVPAPIPMGDWDPMNAAGGDSAEPCPTCGRRTNKDVPGLLLPTGHPLPAPHVRRLASKSRLYRMILKAPSKILDLGSAVRLAPGWMRRAILATYDTCAYNNCPIPAKYCEIDHIHPWVQHQQTKLDDLAPACDHHNRDRAKNPHRYETHRGLDGRWRITTTRRRHLVVDSRQPLEAVSSAGTAITSTIAPFRSTVSSIG